MKLLVLSHVSDYVGGAERSILDVLDNWKDKHGVEVEFVLRKPLGSYIKELDKRGYPYHAVDYTYWSDSNPPRDEERMFTTARRNSKAIIEIEEIIKKTAPDLVMTNSIVAPWAAFAAYFQRVPHVWFAREYGDLDHGREFEIGRKETFEDIGALSVLVVANSQTLASHVSEYIPQHKVTTLYNPFDLTAIGKQASEQVTDPFSDKDSLKLILTSGGITPSKGQLEAITAVGKLHAQGHNVELALIGRDGNKDFMQKLHDIITSYGISDKVHFLGYQKNPLAYAAKADIGIMASKQEAFGRVTFEYIAIGLPVVGANSGATPEIIDDGKNGQVYDVTNVDDLVEKISLYIGDKKKLQQHSKHAVSKSRAMMESEWNVDAAYERIQKAIKDNPVLPVPIHFSHRWLQYPQIAVDYMNAAESMSLKRVAYLRFKQKAKPHYIRMRNIYAKVTGK